MTPVPTYVILGGGLAGHSAAVTLRQSGFDGRIVLIGDEPFPPYDRPPLSKTFLQGKKDAASLPYHTVEQYQELDVELLLGHRAEVVDFANRLLTLDGGDDLAFNKMLIATGSAPIRLRQPGFELNGVHYLRTLTDAKTLRQRLLDAERVLVIGAGFIGSEVAASARMLGRAVCLVDLESVPLKAALGERIGSLYARLHRRHGVDLRLGYRVTELRGTNHVEEAVLDDGTRLECDLVVVGVGVRPQVGIFQETGLEIENGIVVDQHCETNVPGIYAAGDVANGWHPTIGRRLRVEHCDNAAVQGRIAALGMLGQPESNAPIPYFWSDQYDVNLQWVGFPGEWDEMIVRGDEDQPAITAFFVNDGLIQAAITINQPRELRSARRIVEARMPIDPAILADPATDLRVFSRELQSAD